MKKRYVHFLIFPLLLSFASCQPQAKKLQFESLEPFALISSSPRYNDEENPRLAREADPLCNIKIALQDKISYTALPHVLGSNMISLGSSQFGPVETKEEFFNTSYELMLFHMRRVSRAHDIRTDSDFHIIADLERPIHPRELGVMYKRYIQDNDQEILHLATAYKMRISAMREVFPNAKISLYGFPLNRTLDQESYDELMAGMAFLGTLGVFDKVSYLLPVVYFRFGPTDLKGDRKYLNRTIRASKLIKTSDGRSLPVMPFLSFYIYNGSSNHNLEPASIDQFREAFENIEKLKPEVNIEGIGIWHSDVNTVVSNTSNQISQLIGHCQRKSRLASKKGTFHLLGGTEQTENNPRGLIYSFLSPAQRESYIDSFFLRALNINAQKIIFSMPNGWQGNSPIGSDQFFGEEEYTADPQRIIPQFHDLLKRKVMSFKELHPLTRMGVYLSAQIPFNRNSQNCGIGKSCPYLPYSASREDKIYFLKLVASWYHGLGVREFIFDNSSHATFLTFHFELLTWLQNHFPKASFNFESYPGLGLPENHPYQFASIQNYFGAATSVSEFTLIQESKGLMEADKHNKFIVLDENTPSDFNQETASSLKCDGFSLLSTSYVYDQYLIGEDCDEP